MADRIITPAPVGDDERYDRMLRPTSLAEYIGQDHLKEPLSIALQAARQRGEPLEHALVSGPPGLGKTTLAAIIAHELGVPFVSTAGPALKQPYDVAGILSNLTRGAVVFIDEIHRLDIKIEEFLYPPLDEFKVNITMDKGLNASAVEVPVQPFTLIGATTRAGSISKPLRDRFGLQYVLELYSREDLAEIVLRSARLLGLRAHEDAAEELAARARGTARVANRLLRRVRDYAQVRAHGEAVTVAIVQTAMRVEGIDANGLDRLDIRYLRTLAERYRGRPAGLNVLASTLHEEATTLEDVVEPWLLHEGLIEPTPNGRRITPEGQAALASTRNP